MKKNKKDYSNLCYFSLVMLAIFLLIPPVFRFVGKDWYKKEERKKDIIEILTCTKEKDTINSTFLNGEPKNLDYKHKGKYNLVNNDDTLADEVDNKEEKKNSLIDIIAGYANIAYIDATDVTHFKVDMSSMKQNEKYMQFFSNIDNQKSYFNSLSFYCEITKY